MCHVVVAAVEVDEDVEMSYREETGWKDREVEERSHSSSGQTLSM